MPRPDRNTTPDFTFHSHPVYTHLIPSPIFHTRLIPLTSPAMFSWGRKRDSMSLDKWAPIAPSAPGSGLSGGMSGRFGSILKPSKGGPGSAGPMVGRWPESVLLRVAAYLPVADLPAFARVNRGFSRVVRDERGWEGRCAFLRISPDCTFSFSQNMRLGSS